MEKYKLLFEIIGKCCFDGNISQECESSLNDEFLSEVFSEAKRHDIANVFSYCLDKLGLVKEGTALADMCSQEQFLSVYRYENQNYEFGRICSVLNENKISFVILKGAVIRGYYPEPWIRTSCDIDILVKSDEVEKAKDILVDTLGYTFEKKTPHDYQLFSLNGVHLELHYTLIDDDMLVDSNSVLADVWENTEKLDGYDYGYKMNADMFYYFHIVHLAKHILTGGCGIKPFLDLCFIEKNVTCSDKITLWFEIGKLEKFNTVINRLKDVWFLGKDHDEKTKRLEKYVINGGVYGNVENLVSVKKIIKGGTFKYAFGRIFIPYDKLIYRYPQLENKRALLPYYEVKRWFDLLFGGRGKRAFDEFKINSTISDEQVDEVQQMKEDLGI